jgi:hypothetical protein
MISLTLEMTDKRVEAVVRTLDSFTADRQEQVYTLRSALQWLETAAFADKFADPKNRYTCKAFLGLSDIPAVVQQTD